MASTWRNAAYAIRDHQEHYITPAVMHEIMTAHRVRSEHAPVLAQWLHDLGDILYFQDDPDLSDIVILQPQWVTQYISKVLTSEEVFITSACLHVSIWKHCGLISMRRYKITSYA